MKNFLLLNSFLLLGCLLFFRIHPTPPTEKTLPELEERYSHLFRKIAHKIQAQYVEKRPLEDILKNGLKGLSRGLDPYSKILSPKKKDYYQNMKKGSYGGVGLHLSKIEDSLTILYVLPNSPSSQTNLRPGDQIMEIDGEETKELSLSECSGKLKGKDKTHVKVLIKRPSEKRTFLETIQRGQIPLKNLSFADFIDENTFYMKISKFSRDVDRDFREALFVAKKNQLKSLILDFRGNSGGLLSSSLKMLDQIFKSNQVILELKGNNQESFEQKKTRSKFHINEDIKIFALIDERSASASEIVTGAVQDLDRGLVLGAQSFGKGLVQKIYKIDPEFSLKITTARYHTPSGRLIQKKNYEKTEKKDEPVPEIFKTRGGRPVKSNGGITPDIEVKPITLPPFIKALDRKNLFLYFAASYDKLHDLSFPLKLKNEILKEFQEFIQGKEVLYSLEGEKAFFKMKEELENSLKDTMPTSTKKSLEEIESYYAQKKKYIFEDTINQQWILRRLKEKFSYVLGGVEKEVKEKLAYDPYVQKALELNQKNEVYWSYLKGEAESSNQ